MSRQVTVDYQGVSIKVQAQCDTAIHSLCQIDKVLDRIHQNASTFETKKVKEYEEYLIKSKETIRQKIEEVKKALEQYKEIRQYATSAYDSNYQKFIDFKTKVEEESNALMTVANQLTGSKLAIIDQMIEEGLLNAGQESVRELLNKANGVISLDGSVIEQINEIEDVSLRELAYKEYLNDQSIKFDELIIKAQNTYNELLGKKTKIIIERYKEDLKKNGISSEILNNVTSIDEANKAMNSAISDEKVRKETLKIIIKAIKDQGFIVDTKKNLKIDKNRNVVKLVALKASGQKAEFEIQLNGKFMYHFDEYEGQACKKDITPFLEDLKNIYDINITHEEISWENPDKIQTQKYQYINKNKGTN